MKHQRPATPEDEALAQQIATQYGGGSIPYHAALMALTQSPAPSSPTFSLRTWDGTPTPEHVASELERIADQLRDGFTSGEAMCGDAFAGRGWWTTEGLEE